LYFFASLERLGLAPWRKYARECAKRIMDHYEKHPENLQSIGESILKENLEALGIPREEWNLCIQSTLLEIRGWAGMFYRMETHPSEAPGNATVRLFDFCVVKLILDRSSIEALAYKAKPDEIPLALWLMKAPKYQTNEQKEPTSHTSAIAFVDQASERREMLETQFQSALLHTIGTKPSEDQSIFEQVRPSLQLYTCIDDRECSFRRFVEEGGNSSEIETFGIAGFFGMPIRYKPADGRDPMILAPEGQNPTAILAEEESKEDHKKARKYQWRQRLLARASLMWENASFSPTGSLLLSCLFPLSLARLYLVGFFPHMKQKLEENLRHVFLQRPHTDFQLPFPPEQSAALLARTFKDMGTQDRFAPIVVVLGHGATSLNNPFAAAYNCGACGGHEGGPNARLLARLANDKAVRLNLQKDHNISIPDDTVFIGGFHNTTADTVEFFDANLLPQSHWAQFVKFKQLIEDALGKNALERCQKFLLAEEVRTTEEALKHVQMRAVDPAEVRPELNHATNAAVVVGRRELTKSRFLDRRVFLPSYDPFADDDAGTNLEHVLAPALIVCSGINLEYLFSTISVDHHGAGTKAPLNIVGNIGVIQGTSGDLRPGLPSQMTEMHTPVRALYVVDAPVERVEAVLSRRLDLQRLVYNDWVQLVVRHPETGVFYKQSQGQYTPIDNKEKTAFAQFTTHRNHGLKITHREDFVFWSATVGMLLACGVPLFLFEGQAMNPYGIPIALCGTLLSLPVLAYSRRYLHGEFMFARFQVLCVCLLLGFNLTSTAPTLEHAMIGWSLFGFASTFLIGAFNDRPTVRNNATFAFAAYRISDFAILVAATFAHQNHSIAAGALLLAALFKSSQFPLTSLFLRSMEGPTPASALGYAGLSAHVGIVLLTSTMPLWFGFDWARITLGGIGIFTAVHSTLISKVRSDRKGSLARATSATIGLIFVILALGYPELALILSFGHAAFRMMQVLYAPNMITQAQNLQIAIGRIPWPKLVPNWLYRFVWTLRRVDTDFHLLNTLHWISRGLPIPKVQSKVGQWLVTSVCIVLAGAPFTPVSHYMDAWLTELLPTHPVFAGLVMFGHFVISVVLIRFVLLNVLHQRRFNKPTSSSQPTHTKH
jgi:uncharacterized protein YbcC (UPF0753/DUF2309 family)